MRRWAAVAVAAVLGVGVAAWSDTDGAGSSEAGSRGATPRAVRSAREMDRLLSPNTPGGEPLQPIPDSRKDETSGTKAVAPGAPVLNVMREGTLIVDRTGRIHKSADGQWMEFSFDSDGAAMKDPPVVLLPNLKLMAIENELARGGRELRFRITGSVTEYRGRNYILLDKVVVAPEAVK